MTKVKWLAGVIALVLLSIMSAMGDTGEAATETEAPFAETGASTWIPEAKIPPGTAANLLRLQRDRWFGASGLYHLIAESSVIMVVDKKAPETKRWLRETRDRFVILEKFGAAEVLKGELPDAGLYVATTMSDRWREDEGIALVISQRVVLFLSAIPRGNLVADDWGPVLRDAGATDKPIYGLVGGKWGALALGEKADRHEANERLQQQWRVTEPAIIPIVKEFIAFQALPPDSPDRRNQALGLMSKGGIWTAFIKDANVAAWEAVAGRFDMEAAFDKKSYTRGEPVTLFVRLKAPETIDVPFSLHTLGNHYKLWGANVRTQWWVAAFDRNDYGEAVAVRRTPQGRELSFRLDLLCELGRPGKPVSVTVYRCVWNAEQQNYELQRAQPSFTLR